MYLLGLDLGSSSVKGCLVNADTGQVLKEDFLPKQEMRIHAINKGWAEQNPVVWWDYTKTLIGQLTATAGIAPSEISAIGISYQMHGLVVVDKQQQILRPSIIWCDSRAVDIGRKAFEEIGEEQCLSSLLNSPGNFTASKLKWVQDNEPDVYKQIHKFMLPGDYLAMKLTGEIVTTESGLSEGILWDYKRRGLATQLLEKYNIDPSLVAETRPTFGIQGEVSKSVAALLGLKPGTPVTYRAGDQPNNAFSLNVLNPGELAATAGTSGVVYGVSDHLSYDARSRVNTFLHVNHTKENPRYGILMCINGAGSLNSWLRNTVMNGENTSYSEMNAMVDETPIGSDGLAIIPFGNGSERILDNQNICAHMHGLRFNRHDRGHFLRAAQEGVAYAFRYGMDIMKDMGVESKVIRAGHGNMFLNPCFRQTLANISDVKLEIYNTSGCLGAAIGAGVGANIYSSFDQAFRNLSKMKVIEPIDSEQADTRASYENWVDALESICSKHAPQPVAS